MRAVLFVGTIASVVPGGNISHAQTMPVTEGETLSGHRVVLVNEIRGRTVLLVAGFSKDAGSGSGEWVKAIHDDPVLARVPVYQLASLEHAPALIRGMIKSGMRKQTSAAEQDRFLVFTQDDSRWRSYFGVTTDKDPYVVLLDAAGQVRWHGHGAAANLEPLVRAVLK